MIVVDVRDGCEVSGEIAPTCAECLGHGYVWREELNWRKDLESKRRRCECNPAPIDDDDDDDDEWRYHEWRRR